MMSFPFLLKAQDPINSQFQINKLEYNPANGGDYGEGKFAFGAVGKTSFYPIRGPYKYGNTFINYSFFTKNNFKSNLGFLINNETQGDGFLSLTKYSFNWGCSLKILNKINLSIGFRPGIFVQNIDWNELTFSDQLDPIHGITRNSINQNTIVNNSNAFNLDLAGKILIFSNKFNEVNFGFAVFNCLNPKIDILKSYSLPRRYSYQLNFVGKSKEFKFLPSFNHHIRFDCQDRFKLFAYNLELIFHQGFSVGGGLKYSGFSNKTNNISFPIMFSIVYDDMIKIYTSWEPNVVGFNSNTYELGIIFISSNEINKLSDFKDIFTKKKCGNKF